MTNMAAEIGGFTGIVAPDKKVVEFLVERRGMDRERGGDANRRVVQRSRRALCPRDRTRCGRDLSDGGDAGRSR